MPKRVPREDVDEYRVEMLADERVVPRVLPGSDESPDRLDKPQRGIGRVVLRRLTRVRKPVWDHALIDVLRNQREDAAGQIDPACRER